MPPFDYLVVMDFQATSGPSSEIIEFPWVVFDVSALQTVDEKQIFIKPEKNANLSIECQKDTGINDAMLEGACSLQVCVQSFNDYVYRSFVATNKEFCVIACNELTIKYHLWIDAQSKGIKLSTHLLRFLDLSTEFRKFYPQWGAIHGMYDIAERMGISLDRGIKGGLQMCRTAANILARMAAEGAIFSSVVEVSEDYDPLSDPTVQAALSRRDFAPQRDSEHTSRDNSQSRAPVAGPKGGLYVKARGISFSGTEQDVFLLFDGIRIPPGGITMCLNHAGRFNGEAIVRFGTPEDATRALERNGTQVQRRFVDVVPSSLEELQLTEQAYDALRTLDYTDVMYPGVVRMRGLPFNVCIMMVLDFLGELRHGVKLGGVVLCEARDGRRNGEAFVEFSTDALAAEVQKKHREMIGTRYIEIFKVRKGDMIKYLESRFAEAGGFPPPRQPSGRSGIPPISPLGNGEFILKMRGLPFNAREPELVEFFGRAGVTPTALSLCLNAREQPIGEAMAEFGSQEDLEKAKSLNKESLGHRYVELFRVARAMALERLGPQTDAMGPGMGYPPMSSDPYMRTMGGAPNNGYGGDSYGGSYGGYGAGYGGSYSGGGGYGGAFMGSEGQYGQGQGYDAYSASTDGFGGYGAGGGYGGSSSAPSYGGTSVSAYGGGYSASTSGPPAHSSSYGAGMYGGGFTGNYGAQSQPANESSRGSFGGDRGGSRSGGRGACGFSGITAGPSTLKVRGLPWRCRAEEVADFFKGFALAPGDAVHMGTAPDGRFTGEAWVTFASPSEAQRAQTERNRGMMGTRYLELFST